MQCAKLRLQQNLFKSACLRRTATQINQYWFWFAVSFSPVPILWPLLEQPKWDFSSVRGKFHPTSWTTLEPKSFFVKKKNNGWLKCDVTRLHPSTGPQSAPSVSGRPVSEWRMGLGAIKCRRNVSLIWSFGRRAHMVSERGFSRQSGTLWVVKQTPGKQQMVLGILEVVNWKCLFVFGDLFIAKMSDPL